MASPNDRVAQIPELNDTWMPEGTPFEERARMAADLWHEARMDPRDVMEERAVEYLRARDTNKHGDPDGPTFKKLVLKADSRGLLGDEIFEYILGSANRANAEVNRISSGG